MFFDEFCEFSEQVSSELFYAVMDPLYHFVPCCQNFMIMRANYKRLLESNGIQFVQNSFALAPPISTKCLEKITYFYDIDQNNASNKMDDIKLQIKKWAKNNM